MYFNNARAGNQHNAVYQYIYGYIGRLELSNITTLAKENNHDQARPLFYKTLCKIARADDVTSLP